MFGAATGPAFARVREAFRHPIIYLVIYIAMIPVFATIYCAMPYRSFYAPYARYEQSAVVDSDQLRTAIQEAVRRELGKGATHLDRLYWAIDPGSVRVGRIDPADLLLLRTSVAVTVKLFGVDGNQVSQQQVTIPIELNLDDFHRTDDGDVEREPKILTLPNLEFVDNRQVVADLFPQKLPSGHPLDLTLAQAEDVRFRNFMIAMSGEPFALSDARLRMLYFSAVTITTTGFGDIVPLSTAARTLAAAEAVFGWILAGLFLNALARRRNPPLIDAQD